MWTDNGQGGSFSVLAESVETTSFTSTSLSQGVPYQFKVEARNAYGYSEYSDIVTVLAADVPVQPVQPTTTWSQSPDVVIIAWTEPDNGGSPITGYNVLFAQSDGATYTPELSNCD